MDGRFPSGFIWGVATASYQVEGGASEGGRGPSCWDVFVRRPGATRHGDTGDVACDSYHRLEEDLDLIAGMGLGSYRFSVSWSRVLPEGRGQPNQTGLDYYRRLVDGLRGRGVAAMLTLFHWDLPQALQGRGGWANRDCASWFADYAELVARALGGGVEQWVTLNEPAVVADHGYRRGNHAPGVRDNAQAVAATHHLLLGHGLAVERLRQVLGPSARVGLVLDPLHAVALDGADEALAAEVAAGKTDLYLLPVINGAYPELERSDLVPQAPLVKDGDLARVNVPIDFLGVNYYDPVYLRRRQGPLGRGEEPLTGYPGVVTVKPDEFPLTSMGWVVDPGSFHAMLMALARRVPGLPIYITENGCAGHDYPGPDGEVCDPERVEYLRAHLKALKRAIDDGVDVRGYFAWSLLDNFEWADGFSQRFGLVYVDFPTQRRTWKSSAHFYAAVVAANGVPAEGATAGDAALRTGRELP
jgi:beta-glucosidase